MFRDTLRGLDRVFETDIKPPKTVLITGPPGSMKTTFVHSILSKYLENTGEYGFYVTLEEDTESLLEGLESAGIDLSMNMQITDFTQFRQDAGEEADELHSDLGEIDYLAFITKTIKLLKSQFGEQFTVFALDSLGALYSLIRTSDRENMRMKMYQFFKLLRKNRLISFIIMERIPGAPSDLMGNEGFLADGIIYLGLEVNQGQLVRYLQVEKMRACRHSMEKHGVDVGPGGMHVLRPIFDQ